MTQTADMTTSNTPAPIVETIERVSACFPQLPVQCGPLLADWYRASEIVTSTSTVQTLLEQVCQRFGMADRQVAASFLVLGYFWYPMAGALACYLLEQRVPDLAPQHVGLNMGGVALLSRHCWVLPDDPAAGHPDTTVVPDIDELRARIVLPLVEQHAEPLFTILRTVAPYGQAGMRANFTDRLARAVIWLAEQLGDLDIARREVPALIGLVDARSRTDILDLEYEGRQGVFLRRAGCCLNYRLPGKPKCQDCSLIPLSERTAVLQQHLRDASSS